jgi:hypothetical protein
MHGNRRHAEIVTGPLRTEPGVAREFDRAIAYETDVERGATRVAHDDIPRQTFSLGVGETCDGRHCGSGLDEVDGALDHVGEMHDAAEGGADQDVVAVSRRAQVLFEVRQVFLHQGLQRSVDGG